MDLLLEQEAGAARQRLHFDDHVAELAVTARLLLVAALLGHRFADRFAVADARRVALHLDPEAALQPCEHRVEMLVIDPPQADLVIGLVMLDDQRRILLAEPLQRARQLDVVLAVGGLDRDRAVARRIADVDRRRELARAEPLAGLDRVDLGDRDDVAVARFGELLGLLALDLEQRADAGVIAVVGLEVRAFADACRRAPGPSPAGRSSRGRS